MSYDQNDLKDFADHLQTDYRDNSTLAEICSRRFYRNRDRGLDYVQLGKRSPVPINIFEQGIFQPTTSSFARSITQGEINFVVNDLINSADDKLINSIPTNQLSQRVVEDSVKKIGRADTIFIPYADHYDDVVNQWLDDDFYIPWGEGHLEASGNQLQVRRLQPSFGIKDVVIANSEKLEIVQKRYEDTSLPKGMNIDKSVKDVNKDQELMVFFGEDTRPGNLDDQFDEYLDVLYRVVISQPIVKEMSAVRLEAPPGLELAIPDD